ncbi:MAG: ribosome-recycling factor [Phytoplasma sp.]|uniref:ribosome-recycling factor n=1 Tax=Phytoplasma sp. TaxID=2155 RepID=UPI002B4007E4|nr:ribosome-recycling factor [Phytoplasma sp.]WRH06941.1 MAG: ribosome-recycling factor [Phytoplasma sp.]
MEDLTKEILEQLDIEMLTVHKIMLNKFDNIRTGRANPKILDKIIIKYYDSDISLKNISNISVVEGNQINIKPFDNTIINDISKAILNSDLGITPENDGQIVKLVFPKPTEEKRQMLIKEVKKTSEQIKIQIRNIIRRGKDKFYKMKTNETIENIFLKDLKNLNNKWIKSIDNEIIKKNNELSVI